jgi:hypothetical protein
MTRQEFEEALARLSALNIARATAQNEGAA